MDLQFTAAINGTLDIDARFKDPSTGRYEISRHTVFGRDAAGNPLPDGVYANDGSGDVAPQTAVAPLTMSDMVVNVMGVEYAATNPAWVDAALAHAQAQFENELGRALTSSEISALRAATTGTGGLFTADQVIGNNASVRVSSASASAGGGSSGSTVIETKDFSPNRFLARHDKIRLLYWREVP